MNEFQKRDLASFLSELGFRYFDSEEYWVWGGQELQKCITEKEFNLLEKHRKNIQKGSDVNKNAFYDFHASKNIHHILHSMKFDAIKVSGTEVSNVIFQLKPSRVLDLGCNTGYLSCWYAISNPSAEIVGVDISEESITIAKKVAKKFNLRNIRFYAGDFQKRVECQFDLIVDTQTICESQNNEKLINWVASHMTEQGFLLSIPQTGNEKEFSQFIGKLINAGIHPHQYGCIQFSDLGISGMYPVILASKVRNEPPDLSALWDDIRRNQVN